MKRNSPLIRLRLIGLDVPSLHLRFESRGEKVYGAVVWAAARLHATRLLQSLNESQPCSPPRCVPSPSLVPHTGEDGWLWLAERPLFCRDWTKFIVIWFKLSHCHHVQETNTTVLRVPSRLWGFSVWVEKLALALMECMNKTQLPELDRVGCIYYRVARGQRSITKCKPLI